MRTYHICANINGAMIFEIKARSEKEAIDKVKDTLNSVTVLDAFDRFKNTMDLNYEVKKIRDREER